MEKVELFDVVVCLIIIYAFVVGIYTNDFSDLFRDAPAHAWRAMFP